MRRLPTIPTIALFCSLLGAAGCGQGGTQTGTPATPDVHPDGPSLAVTATDIIPDSLRTTLDGAETMDAATLQATYPTPATQTIGYDPISALGMDTIQASTLALNANELVVLAAKGMVISRR